MRTMIIQGAGIPLSEPMRDPSRARAELTSLYQQYPGQLFMLNESISEDGALVVTWIPYWQIPYLLTGMMSSYFNADFQNWYRAP